MSGIFIGIGSNQNNPKQLVLESIEKIDAIVDLKITKQSSLYKTSPIGFMDQPDFINAVIEVAYKKSPELLLKNLLEIEVLFGRIRKEKNGPRTLDLDILLFKNIHMNKNNLIIPHQRMHERLFVLLPLHEIAPNIFIEPYGSIKKLISNAPDSTVKKIEL